MHQAPSTKHQLYAWYVVGVLTLAHVSSFVDRQILALLVDPIKRDLAISNTQMGVLMGLPFAVFYALMGIPVARIADSGSRRNVIGIGIALWSLMTALSGLAGTYGRLLLARVGVGVGEAALVAPATSLVTDYFPRERLATAMGVFGIGIFLGSGLAYWIGGWAVGLASVQEQWTLPLIGAIRPWQTVFLIVGLPGLLIAALMLTVREPERQDHSRGTVPLSALWAFVRSNFKTIALYIGGFTASASVNNGLALWINQFLTHGFNMSVSRAGMIQGTMTMTIGVVAVTAGGRLTDALSRRGHVDAPLRVGLMGAGGMLVSATAFGLSGTESGALWWLAVVNVFAALPWGAALSGSARLVPATMRSQGVAMFNLFLSLVALTLGPLSVGFLTDRLFGGDAGGIGPSMAIVSVFGMITTIGLLGLARAPFRRMIGSLQQ